MKRKINIIISIVLCAFCCSCFEGEYVEQNDYFTFDTLVTIKKDSNRKSIWTLKTKGHDVEIQYTFFKNRLLNYKTIHNNRLIGESNFEDNKSYYTSRIMRQVPFGDYVYSIIHYDSLSQIDYNKSGFVKVVNNRCQFDKKEDVYVELIINNRYYIGNGDIKSEKKLFYNSFDDDYNIIDKNKIIEMDIDADTIKLKLENSKNGWNKWNALITDKISHKTGNYRLQKYFIKFEYYIRDNGSIISIDDCNEYDLFFLKNYYTK